MNGEQAPVLSNTQSNNSTSNDSMIYDGKTFKDFFAFCSFVLAYEEQVKSTKLDNLIFNKGRGLGSAGHTDTSSDEDSSNDERGGVGGVGGGGGGVGGGGRKGGGNTKCGGGNKRKRKEEEEDEEGGDDNKDKSDSDTSSSNQVEECTSDEDSWNLVTCYCGRPYAGRPMIECSKCLTWVHLYCAKIKKNNVPEFFLCQKCKKKQQRTK